MKNINNNIEYLDQHSQLKDPILASELIKATDNFFVNWPKKPKKTKISLFDLLTNSSHFVIARDVKTGQVVGFINCLSDQVLSAYIPLLEVLPEYQKQKIGQKLFQKLWKKLENLYRIDLICDENVLGFWQKLGFKTGEGLKACVIRNHKSLK